MERKTGKQNGKNKLKKKYLRRCLAQGTRGIHDRNNLTKELKTMKKGDISVIY